MALTEKQAMKKLWQSKEVNTHRVRFFTHLIPVDSLIDDSKIKRFHQVADAFKKTSQYQWVEDNDIKLKWMEDDVHYAYSRQVILYSDLTESQFVDYSLRFFDHHNEAWK
jgi:sialic acid synthase SpsE